jgi:hypothetical protein
MSISKGGGEPEGKDEFCRRFFDLVGIFANWCISQDLEQDCEAATCCLTALPVGRGFAQYGQRGDIFWIEGRRLSVWDFKFALANAA